MLSPCFVEGRQERTVPVGVPDTVFWLQASMTLRACLAARASWRLHARREARNLNAEVLARCFAMARAEMRPRRRLSFSLMG